MRLFTAVDLSPDVRANLAALLDRLRPSANLGWSPVENLHVTTCFLGEWPEARRQELDAALASVPKAGAFEVAIRGLGWFPNPHSPRVFWAGVQGDEALNALAAHTDRAVTALGVEPEKREYTPHLTLARIRDGMSKDALNAVRRAVASLDSSDFGVFRAASQFLYLSAGGKYTGLAEFSLV